MGNKDETLHIKIRSDEKDEITETAEYLDIPVSQFIREAAREKIAIVRERAQYAGMDVTKEGVTVVDGNGKILQKPITGAAA
ncbi:MAG: ribbon-helix-helix protein, CopG family [Chloracidobacterium sp.]|nr:ribbon-helix-helix protein, CopG family [Chloracidobacterium sp.]